MVTPADTDTNTSMTGETEDPWVGSTTTPTTTVDPTIAETTDSYAVAMTSVAPMVLANVAPG